MTLVQQSILALCAATVCLAQGPSNQYLPPDKGYSYEPPKVPFPSGPGPSVTKPPAPPVAPPAPPAQPPGIYGPPPVGPPAPPPPPSSPGGPYPPAGKPAYGPDSHLDQPHVPGMPFEFDYAVNDPVHMAYYSHNAASDGDQVKGEYRVQLPDGRTQIVSYVADWATGFHADVKYEGEATYPAPAPAGPSGGGYPAAGAPSGGGYPAAGAPSGGGYPAAGAPSGGGYPAAGAPSGPAPGSFPSPPAPSGGAFTGYPAPGPPEGVTGGGGY